MYNAKRKRRDFSHHHSEKSLTQDQYNTLLRVAPSYEDRILLQVGVELGLRRSDITRIQISDIDLHDGWLSYKEKKKSDKIRRVPISPSLREELHRYLDTIPKKQTSLFSFQDRAAWDHLAKMCDVAGISRIPFHALRGTAAKFRQAQGWSVEATAKLLGDQVATIQNYYTTPSDQELQQLMDGVLKNDYI